MTDPTDPNANYFCLATALGLSPAELAEITGYGKTFMRDALAGKVALHDNVKEALVDLQSDCDVIADRLFESANEGHSVLVTYSSNDLLREHIPQWPGRGEAAGGFASVHRVAAREAREALASEGVYVDIVFAEQRLYLPVIDLDFSGE